MQLRKLERSEAESSIALPAIRMDQDFPTAPELDFSLRLATNPESYLTGASEPAAQSTEVSFGLFGQTPHLMWR